MQIKFPDHFRMRWRKVVTARDGDNLPDGAMIEAACRAAAEDVRRNLLTRFGKITHEDLRAAGAHISVISVDMMAMTPEDFVRTIEDAYKKGVEDGMSRMPSYMRMDD